MATEPRVTAELLRAALSPATYLALFDDEQCGVVSEVDISLPVTLTLRRAHTRVQSRLATICGTRPLPGETAAGGSDLLLDAELNYAIGMAFDRHPEYVRAYGEGARQKGAWSMAESIMEDLQAAVLRVVDATPEAAPSNVGGILFSSARRVMLPGSDGSANSGDF